MAWEDQPTDRCDHGEEIFHVTDGRYDLESLGRFQGAGIDVSEAPGIAHYPTSIVERKQAPRSDWSEMGEREHFVQLYETDAFLLTSLCGYIGAGLRAGDACIVVATQGVREGLEERLRADGVDVAAALTRGQYIALDAAEMLSTFMVLGAPEPGRFAQVFGEIIRQATEGRRRVRVFGEMVALLWTEGNHAGAIRLEELWNDLHGAHRFSLFCGYPMRIVGGEALAEALGAMCGAHTRVIPAESYAALASPEDRLRAIVLLQQKAQSLEAEIAERKRIEESLRESEAALHRALYLRDEFLSAISHDLKTPLTVLKGQAQMLRRRATRGALGEDTILAGLEQIESKSRQMAELIDELLDVTRLSAGEELQLDRRMVDLVALTRNVATDHAELTNHHRVVILSEEPDLIGSWDRLRLARVIENLVSNAIKYSPRGGDITVTLIREKSPEGDYAVLAVQDWGMGIAEDDLPCIFERFYRGKNAGSAMAGAGLGLAGVRQIVEQHGGTIAVDSREGVGSTFTVRLPLEMPHSDPRGTTHRTA